MELLQAALFHVAFLDLAAGQKVREPGGMNSVEAELRQHGLPQDVMDRGWACLKRYQEVFNGFVFQNTLITFRSQWDWYIRKLAAFVIFARKSTTADPLPPDIEKSLMKMGYREMPISTQLSTLRQATALPLEVCPVSMDSIAEMSLVRNLGLHNRWEVDHLYISKTTSKQKWEAGELRVVEAADLLPWQQALIELLQMTSLAIAQLYVNAPDVPTQETVTGR